MRTRTGLLLLSSMVLVACGGGSGTDQDGSVFDADPLAPDADPLAPDADPFAPDAGPGDPDAAVSCGGGLELCGGSCVDLMSNDAYCGSCTNACTDGRSCVLGGCVTGVGTLVLSEVHARHPAFIELYNGASTAVDLAGHLVQWNTDGAGSGSVSLPSYSLGPDEFVVLQEGAGATGDGVIFLGEDIGWREHIAVRLLAPGGAGLDFVRTGASAIPPPTGTSWNGPNSPNPSATVDQSLIRNVYVADTDSAADWRIASPSSPGTYCANDGRCGDTCHDLHSDRQNCGACGYVCGDTQLCADAQCRSGFVGLWISEYRRYPRPGIEVHNPTATAVLMTGYKLNINGPSTLSFDFPDGFTLQPGAYVFVYMGNGQPNATTLFTGPSAAFGPDVGIALFDSGATAVDFVRFGASAAPVPANTNWFGGNVASPPMDRDVSARRNVLLVDSDSANDWVAGGPSTPGFSCYANLSLCGGVCTARTVDPDHCGSCGNACSTNETCTSGVCSSVGGVVLSELRFTSSRGFEIFNGTSSTVNLNGWKLSWYGYGGGSYTHTSDFDLAPGAFVFLHGSGGTNNASNIVMNETIQWTDSIAVWLVNSGDDAVDFVRTGTSETTPPSGTSWTRVNAPNPSATANVASLTRQVWSADTNSAADWSLSAASPARYCPAAADSVCGGQCANLETNPQHCGACGVSARRRPG